MRGLSNIRLRYTGLVNFASQLFTIVTGFLFVVTVTRNLTTTEFGVWQNISDVLGYALILIGVIPFSATRYLSQGHRDAIKTGIVANILVSVPLTGIFMFLSPYLASTIGTNPLYFQVAAFEILLLYLLQVLQGSVLAIVPHLLGFGTTIYEVTKIVLGIVLVIHFDMGLVGAIAAVVASQTILSFFYLITIRGYLKEKIKWNYLRSWWRMSVILVYGELGDRLGALGPILLILMWGTTARAYVGAALTIAVMISYSNALAMALYPKLLAELHSSSVEAALKLTMLFAIPMTGGIIILSDSLLTILKPDYSAASIILSIYAIVYLLDCFSATMNTVIMATERADMDKNATLRGLLRSRLFLLPTLTYVRSGIYLVMLVLLLRGFTTTPFQAALYTSTASISASIPIFLLRYRIAKRSLPFKLPTRNIVSYVLATILMMSVISQIHLAATLSRTLALIGVGAVVYFCIIVVIDSEARTLVQSVVGFARKKLRDIQ